MTWKFTLQNDNNTIEVYEPVNFDSVEFSLKRDLKTHGVVFEFSTNCSFYKEARQFILDALYSQNINAEITVFIQYLDTQQNIFKFFYKGLLGLRNIEITDTFAILRIENDSFLRKFNSKKDLNVSLIPNLQNVELHSKVIRQASSWVYDSQFTTISREINLTQFSKINAYLFPLSQKQSELENTSQITNFIANNVSNLNNPPNGNPEVPNHYIQFRYSGVVKIKYKFNGKFILLNNTATSANGNIILQLFNSNEYYFNVSNNIWVSGVLASLPAFVPKVFNISLEGEININVNQNERLFFHFITNTNGDVSTSNIVTSFELFEGSYFEVIQDTQNLPTLHKGITVFEAFRQIVENYTGNGAKFKSDFFQYGCGANRMLTNGFWLRQLNEKEFFANFKDLFESLQNIDNLALSIYKEGNQNVVRIEAMPYFYKAQLLQNFQYPNNLKITLSNELYANKINVGYEIWQNEAVGQVNGLDEFNAKMQFATKVESANYFDNEGSRNEFNFLSKIIASGYLIEYVRRQIGKDSTDTQYDNSTFIVCLNESNTKAEKNENFETVENIISPETAYNLRISPKRNLLNFAPQITAQLVKGNAQLKDVQFRSAEGNFNMLTKSISDCLQQNEIIEKENFELLKENAIFEAEIYTFTYPLTFAQYQIILNEPYSVIEIEFDKTKFAGFLIELKYKPNSGLADFKLLKCALDYSNPSFEFQDGQIYEFQDGQIKEFQDSDF